MSQRIQQSLFRADPLRRTEILTFVRHFLEMLAAMLVGMAALWALLSIVLALTDSGYTDFQADAPAPFLALMGAAMALPMAAWMRHRAHRPARIAEMSGAMGLLTITLIVLHAIGLDGKAATEAQHSAMIPVMLAAMLPRYRDYSRRSRASDI